MADKRIYELTDEQATYVAELLVAVEASGDPQAFLSTKKMRLDAIYKKIFALDTASGVNVDQFLLRLDNNGGAETKIKLSNFIALFTDSDEVVDVPLYNIGTQQLATLTLRRFGKLVNGIMKIEYAGDYTTDFLYEDIADTLYELPAAFRPKYDCSMEINSAGATSDGLNVYTDGTMKLKLLAAHTNKNFMLSWVTG
jgi:hypothetical protein